MYYVYVIKSVRFPSKRYTGFTTNLTKRLEYHNNLLSKHTAKLRPWKLETCIMFADKTKAQNFELYLKSGSGRAFAKKRF